MFYCTLADLIAKLNVFAHKTSTLSPSKQSDVALLFPPGRETQYCRIVVRATHHVAPSSELLSVGVLHQQENSHHGDKNGQCCHT
jgi:hypothetical protein